MRMKFMRLHKNQILQKLFLMNHLKTTNRKIVIVGFMVVLN